MYGFVNELGIVPDYHLVGNFRNFSDFLVFLIIGKNVKVYGKLVFDKFSFLTRGSRRGMVVKI